MQTPRIIITPALSDNQRNLLINRGYYDSVLRVGGIPILMPLTDDPAVLNAYLASCDGVLFSGGPDVHPRRYGETVHPSCGAINELRDTMEMYLLNQLFRNRIKPILCICRGIQVLNVALQGTLYQDIPSEYAGFVFSHSQPEHECDHAHSVSVVKNTLLHKAFEASDIDFEPLYDTLKGSTAVMFANVANIPAKLLKEYTKEGIPALKAAYAEEGIYVGADKLEELAAIKSKNEVIAEIVTLLQSPAKNVVSALQSGANTIHGVLKTLGERPE